ncbi:aminoglycoside phosphotransferase family protein [Agrobacterium tumefaciens]|uniref:aminoglycoside phosphotransferase family protein n=1 Tax=Agrobacterium tumefaciens TaxID=358 RepID=UPI001572E3FD|nr:aminoglycoside phosphotransferase family protein [Agrobacterium tumefaciens]
MQVSEKPSLIEMLLPLLPWPTIEMVDLNAPIDGHRNRVVRLEASDGPRILKLYESEDCWEVEAVALRMVGGESAPRILKTGSFADAGFWTVISVLPSIPWDRDALISGAAFTALGRHVKSIHSRRAAFFGSIGTSGERFGDWCGYVERSYARSRDYLSRHSLMPSTFFNEIDLRFHQGRTIIASVDRAALIHRDLRPANIAMSCDDAWACNGLIDFEHAVFGDPLMDVSRLHDEVLRGRKEWEDSFWEGYDPDLECADRFAECSGFYDLLRYFGGMRFALSNGDQPFFLANLTAVNRMLDE